MRHPTKQVVVFVANRAARPHNSRANQAHFVTALVDMHSTISPNDPSQRETISRMAGDLHVDEGGSRALWQSREVHGIHVSLCPLARAHATVSDISIDIFGRSCGRTCQTVRASFIPQGSCVLSLAQSLQYNDADQSILERRSGTRPLPMHGCCATHSA